MEPVWRRDRTPSMVVGFLRLGLSWPRGDFPLDVGTTATPGRRSPNEVLSTHGGQAALAPRGRVATSEMVQGVQRTVRSSGTRVSEGCINSPRMESGMG